MKKIFLSVVLLISAALHAQIPPYTPPPGAGIDDDTLQYRKDPYTYGVKQTRVYATKALRTPKDTIYTKSGLAIFDYAHGSTMWFGDDSRWWQVGSGGLGTVTSVDAEDLSPLFTTVVNTPTSTPDIVFTLSNTTQYKFFGRIASGSGAPSYVSIDTYVRSLFLSGTAISYNSSTGEIINTGVTAIAATPPITVSASTGSVTVSTSMAASKVAGRGSAGGTGVMQELAIAGILSISGTTLTATEVDGSITNEIQDVTLTGTTTVSVALSSGSTWTITGGGIAVISRSGNAITVTATEAFLGTVTSIDMSGGTTGLTASGGPITNTGTFTLGGTLVVGHGGTGSTSFTQYGVLYGNNTSALQVTGAGTQGQIFLASSTAPYWGNVVTNFTKFTAGFSSSDTNYKANLWVSSGRGYDTTSYSSFQLLASTYVAARIFMNGTDTVKPEDGYVGANAIMARQYIREDTTGTHPLMAGYVFLAPAIVNGDGATKDAATVYIDGAPTGITPATGGYMASLWIRSGNLRMGQETVSTGSISWEGSTAGRFVLTVPNSFTSWNGKWPGDDGNANEVLITDGSGNMDWVSFASIATFQTLSFSGTSTPTITLSDGGGSFSFTGAGIAVFSRSGSAITLTATEVDGSTSNELQTITVSGTTTISVALSDGGGTWTLEGAGIAAVTRSGNDIFITATEVDGSVVNEYEQFYNINSAGTHTLKILNTNTATYLGSLQYIAGDGINFSTGGGSVDATLTISTSKKIDAGTYTPTLYDGSNASGVSASVCQWLRVGNTVTVSGRIEFNYTTGNTSTTLGISLPVASDFAGDNQCAGTAGHTDYTNPSTMVIIGDASNNRAAINSTSPDTPESGGGYWYIHFTYLIVE